MFKVSLHKNYVLKDNKTDSFTILPNWGKLFPDWCITQMASETISCLKYCMPLFGLITKQYLRFFTSLKKIRPIHVLPAVDETLSGLGLNEH